MIPPLRAAQDPALAVRMTNEEEQDLRIPS